MNICGESGKPQGMARTRISTTSAETSAVAVIPCLRLQLSLHNSSCFTHRPMAATAFAVSHIALQQGGAQRCCSRAGACLTRLSQPSFDLLQRRHQAATWQPHSQIVTVAQAQKAQFASFDSLIKESQLPVLVEFYATWCGPCQMMGKVLEEVAPTFKSRCKFIKVDSDKYGALASQHHIGGLPTLILFKNGRPVDRLEGMLPAADFQRWLQSHL